MATIVLGANEDFTLPAGQHSVYADASQQTVTVSAGASVTFLAGSIGDNIVLAGNAANYTAVLNGNQVTLTDTTTGATIVVPAGTTATSVAFDDGARDLIIDTTGATPAITLGGTEVTDTPAPVGGEPTNPTEPGETFTLTTGTDELTLTAGDDTVDGTVANSLTAADKILDESSEDNDTLNVKLSTADVQATVKNIENVNVDWTSNNTIALDATNMSGNTFNLSASGLAFNGNATIKAAGTNNVNAGDDVTNTLQLNDVINSTVDAGAATKVLIEAGTVNTVGQKTTANVTVNGDVTIGNDDTAASNTVEVLTIAASTAATVTLTGEAAADNGSAQTTSGIGDSVEVTGSNAITLKGAVNAEKIINSLSGAELTVNSTDTGALDVSKVDANLINLTGAATAVTVADNQNLGVVSATGALTSLVASAGQTNVTTNLTTDGNIAALDVTGISNLNLDVTDVATIALTTDADNNVVVTGAGDLTLTSAGVSAIDASAMTGKLTYTAANAATGIIGSSTAKNDITLTAIAAENGTIVLGSADDKVTIGAAATGTLSVDGGAGTDTLSLTNVDAIVGAKTTISNVENISAITGVKFTEKQISGETFNLTATSGDANLVVNVANAAGSTAVTTDLSGLTFGNTVGANFSTVTVTGKDAVVDTVKGTSLNDTIDAGTKGDIIDISQGGSDVIAISADGDSTYTADTNNMDSITGFDMSSTASVADQITFSAYSKAEAADNIDVKAAISGGTGAETVTATIDANGILTVGGVDATAIDTLAEWQEVADLMVQEGSGATAGETLAFLFSGNTYIYNYVDGTAGNDNIVELVGVTGATEIGATGATAINIA